MIYENSKALLNNETEIITRLLNSLHIPRLVAASPMAMMIGLVARQR